MSKTLEINRRTALRGLGTSLALPLLDVMVPSFARAAAEGAAAGRAAPLRLAFVYIPNGAHMPDWTPQSSGANFDLPPILRPLEPVREYVNVLSHLALDKANAHGEVGDHARASGTFLTAVRLKRSVDSGIQHGVSVDQLAAQSLGTLTRIPSLEIGCDPSGAVSAGVTCDSYPCVYSNMTWKTESTPVSREVNPKLVFERLFASDRPDETAEARAKREQYNRSILDFVYDDARRVRAKLGISDQRKLDEYLNSVREIEQRIARSIPRDDQEVAKGVAKPDGIPKDYAEHLRVLGDLLALAFQGDITRVSTFIFAGESSGRSYPMIGVAEGHHDLSHHAGDREKQAKISRINHFHIEHFAYLLGKLKSIREGEGTLLDNCLILYGSGISDGDQHRHDNLPILLAGRGGGTVKSGRHIQCRANTPLANLYVSMLQRIGVRRNSFGDSSGQLAELDT